MVHPQRRITISAGTVILIAGVLCVAGIYLISYCHNVCLPYYVEDYQTVTLYTSFANCLSSFTCTVKGSERGFSYTRLRPLSTFFFYLANKTGVPYLFLHCLQLIIHLGNALFIYRITRSIAGRNAAHFSSLLWLLYPFHTTPVLWISAIYDLLATFFILAFLAFLPRQATGNAMRLFFLLPLLAAACFSKEYGVVLVIPGLLAIVASCRRRLWRYIFGGLFIMVPLYLVLFHLIFQANIPATFSLAGYCDNLQFCILSLVRPAIGHIPPAAAYPLAAVFLALTGWSLYRSTRQRQWLLPLSLYAVLLGGIAIHTYGGITLQKGDLSSWGNRHLYLHSAILLIMAGVMVTTITARRPFTLLLIFLAGIASYAPLVANNVNATFTAVRQAQQWADAIVSPGLTAAASERKVIIISHASRDFPFFQYATFLDAADIRFSATRGERLATRPPKRRTFFFDMTEFDGNDIFIRISPDGFSRCSAGEARRLLAARWRPAFTATVRRLQSPDPIQVRRALRDFRASYFFVFPEELAALETDADLRFNLNLALLSSNSERMSDRFDDFIALLQADPARFRQLEQAVPHFIISERYCRARHLPFLHEIIATRKRNGLLRLETILILARFDSAAAHRAFSSFDPDDLAPGDLVFYNLCGKQLGQLEAAQIISSSRDIRSFFANLGVIFSTIRYQHQFDDGFYIIGDAEPPDPDTV